MPKYDVVSNDSVAELQAREVAYRALDLDDWADDDGPADVQEALDELADLIFPMDWVPDSLNVATGVTVVGNVESLKVLDDADVLNIGEVGGVPGFNIEIDFVDITETPNRLEVYVYYDGSAGHTVNVQIYDQVGLGWDTLGTIPDGGAAVVKQSFDIDDGAKYVKGDNTVETRVYHSSPGNVNHDIFIDLVLLRKLPVSGGGGISNHAQLTNVTTDQHHTENHTILNGSAHTDSVADGVTRGSIIVGNSTPKWAELVAGAAGTILGSDGTDVSWGQVPTKNRTFNCRIFIANPTDSDDYPLDLNTANAITFTEVYTEVDAATSVTFNLYYRARGSLFSSPGTKIITTDPVATTGGDTETVFINNGSGAGVIPANSEIFLVASAVAGTPTKLLCIPKYTIN